MRVCVPLRSKSVAALGALTAANPLPLAAHFGEAACFAVIDSDSGEWLGECRIDRSCPGPCHCPLPDLDAASVDLLAGHAAGFRLMQLSRRAGIPLVSVKAHSLDELRRELAAGAPLRPIPAPVCLSRSTGMPSSR